MLRNTFSKRHVALTLAYCSLGCGNSAADGTEGGGNPSAGATAGAVNAAGASSPPGLAGQAPIGGAGGMVPGSGGIGGADGQAGLGGNAASGAGGMGAVDPSDDNPIEPLSGDKPAFTVSTLAELRAAIQLSGQVIVMKAGNYALADLPSGSRNLPFSGSNNDIDLVGVQVDVPVGATARESYLTIEGSGNMIRGGTFEDTYSTGLAEVVDYFAYNQDQDELAYGLRGAAVMSVLGSDNLIDHLKLTVRGSYPYGYGSIYGIGAENVFGLNKRCGIVVKGRGNTIQNTEVQQRAFCHGIYLQAPADNTTIRNTLVEGVMRPSSELYQETDPESLPSRSGFKLPLEPGTPDIPMDVMLPLSEDGIRVYDDGGSVTVENCVVKKMRGGIRLYLASSATVSDSKAVDCGMTNFNLPSGGTVTNSSANFAYAPASDFRLARSNQDLELTIIPSPHATGPHNVADVLGNNHTIVFHRTPGPVATGLRSIVVSGNGSTIRNETEYPIIVTGSDNEITSAGAVTDQGANNEVVTIPLP